jgi:flagellar hook-length control protein FliK
VKTVDNVSALTAGGVVAGKPERGPRQDAEGAAGFMDILLTMLDATGLEAMQGSPVLTAGVPENAAGLAGQTAPYAQDVAGMGLNRLSLTNRLADWPRQNGNGAQAAAEGQQPVADDLLSPLVKEQSPMENQAPRPYLPHDSETGTGKRAQGVVPFPMVMVAGREKGQPTDQPHLVADMQQSAPEPSENKSESHLRAQHWTAETEQGLNDEQLKPVATKTENALTSDLASQPGNEAAMPLAKSGRQGLDAGSREAGNEPSVQAERLAQDFPEIVISRLKTIDKANGSKELVVQLEPKELGKMVVKLTSEEGIVSVKILAHAPVTKDLLESGLNSLRQSFMEQGIRFDRMDVELGGEQFNENFFAQQQEHDPWQHGKTPSFRKLTYEAPGYFEQELTEAEESNPSLHTGNYDYLV